MKTHERSENLRRIRNGQRIGLLAAVLTLGCGVCLTVFDPPGRERRLELDSKIAFTKLTARFLQEDLEEAIATAEVEAPESAEVAETREEWEQQQIALAELQRERERVGK